jgi:hypothetical protein
MSGDSSGQWGDYTLSSGLLNSATLVSEMLNDLHLADSKIVQVDSNNEIDREIYLHNANVCIVEAFWVVPEKFDVLKEARPNCRFIVRNHSEMPFLSQEGVALGWSLEYVKRGVYLASNVQRTNDDFVKIAKASGYTADQISKFVLLPNFYPVRFSGQPSLEPGPLHIGCFGSIRPLKNMLQQAIAALEYADSVNRVLRFHINGLRVEMGGAPILKNVQSLFDAAADKGHELVMHPWAPHSEFKELMSTMDLSMQVAFSETFNIVTADAVTSGVPVVVSPEIAWVADEFKAQPTDTEDIVRVIGNSLNQGLVGVIKNIIKLASFDRDSIRQWTNILRAV